MFESGRRVSLLRQATRRGGIAKVVAKIVKWHSGPLVVKKTVNVVDINVCYNTTYTIINTSKIIQVCVYVYMYMYIICIYIYVYECIIMYNHMYTYHILYSVVNSLICFFAPWKFHDEMVAQPVSSAVEVMTF